MAQLVNFRSKYAVCWALNTSSISCCLALNICSISFLLGCNEMHEISTRSRSYLQCFRENYVFFKHGFTTFHECKVCQQTLKKTAEEKKLFNVWLHLIQVKKKSYL